MEREDDSGANALTFAAILVVASLGCSVHEHPLAAAGVDASCTPAPAANAGIGVHTSAQTAGCATVKTGGALCDSVPKFTGPQVVDGVGDEFCDVPATVFELPKGVPFPQTPPPLTRDVLTARVAWDADGIHAHFHADDPVLVRDYRYDGQWGPDYIELAIGGTYPLTGFYDGMQNDAGFINLFLSPSSALTPIKGFTGAVPPQVTLMLIGDRGDNYNVMPAGVPDIVKWAYRTVAGGYEFELFIPWKLLGRVTAPAAGATVSLDLGFGTNDDPKYWSFWPTTPQTGAPNLSGQSFLAIKPLPANVTRSSCYPQTVDRANPWCDDRTWCQPTLE